MKLIERSALEAASKSQKWFEYTTPSSDFQIGFMLGGGWAAEQLQPKFVEFENFCQKTRSRDHAIALDEQASTGSLPFTKYRTTEELFDLWIEEQTKTK